MATKMNEERWTGTVNEAGDTVYERNTGTKPAKKKPAAKKKA